MLRIGLTGGIGSGKTTVAQIFEILGVPVYYADDAAKRLMNSNVHLVETIKSHFGTESYIDSMLNRPYLAKMVFSNPEKLRLLNSLVHPATIKDADRWMNAQSAPYVVKEAALIFESDAHKVLDYVTGVYAPVELRLQRAMQRDHLSKEEIELKINQQMDESKKLERCDFIINNDETELLIPQVVSLNEKLLGLTQKHQVHGK